MKFIFSFLCLIILVFSCRQQGKTNLAETPRKASETKKVWRITSTTDVAKNQGLLNVESIVYDQLNQTLYASNGKDYKPGIDGFISKVSLDGTVEELKWVSNLNRPTGMAVKDSILYVADVNVLLAINTKTGKIISKYPEPINNSGLNDVATNKHGEVYVSASFVHAVFRLKDNALEPWKTDSEIFKWANGLSASNERVIVGGLNLSSTPIDSREVEILNTNPAIKDFDGIEPDGYGGYFLTTVENSGLFHLHSDETTTQIMDGQAYFGDLEFIANQNAIYVPRGIHKTNNYFITILIVE
ncbi:hypothetical protein [Flagellimonas sp. S3867]|uniref:hypothetical protein n=1 Tax=Flagellimonas sp. S3867 TaxID=2768063 RepID=UPI00168856CA|nr:hypothetical protein [Flagellimonas sp. S3867]